MLFSVDPIALPPAAGLSTTVIIIIIGVAGGAIVIIAVVVILVVCLCRRKGRSNGGPGGDNGFELGSKVGTGNILYNRVFMCSRSLFKLMRKLGD